MTPQKDAAVTQIAERAFELWFAPFAADVPLGTKIKVRTGFVAGYSAALADAEQEVKVYEKCKCGVTGPVCPHNQDEVSMWNDGCTYPMGDDKECGHDRKCHAPAIHSLADAHPELATAAEGLMSLSIHEPKGWCKCVLGTENLICGKPYTHTADHHPDTYCNNRVDDSAIPECGHDKACHAPTDSPTNTGDGK